VALIVTYETRFAASADALVRPALISPIHFNPWSLFPLRPPLQMRNVVLWLPVPTLNPQVAAIHSFNIVSH
jgi:hypothetical protein